MLQPRNHTIRPRRAEPQERIAARSTAGVFVVAGSLIVVGVVVHVRIGV